jgi:hypothetical protein
MLSFLAGLFLGVLLGWLTLGSLVNEEVRGLLGRVLRIVARILAGTACALGLGLVIWTSADLALDIPFRPLVPFPNVRYDSPGEAYGVGAALLFGGILGLVFTFLGRKTSTTARQGTEGGADGTAPFGAETGPGAL